MMVKRAAVGAEGFVLDHYDRGALARYLDAVGRPMLERISPRIAAVGNLLRQPRGLRSDWTPRLLDEFERAPRLRSAAAPAGACRRRHARSRRDPSRLGPDADRAASMTSSSRLCAPGRRRTARSCAHNLRHAAGVGVEQALASICPKAKARSGASCRATRWAASASHVAGTPITSSETWTWLHSPSFMASPLDIKAEADRHFLQGVNQLVGHGWPYSPPAADYPGWRFYAAGALQRSEPVVDRHARCRALAAAH